MSKRKRKCLLPLAIIPSPTKPDDVMTPEKIERYLDLWIKWTLDMATVQLKHPTKICQSDYKKVEEIGGAVRANVASSEFFSKLSRFVGKEDEAWHTVGFCLTGKRNGLKTDLTQLITDVGSKDINNGPTLERQDLSNLTATSAGPPHAFFAPPLQETPTLNSHGMIKFQSQISSKTHETLGLVKRQQRERDGYCGSHAVVNILVLAGKDGSYETLRQVKSKLGEKARVYPILGVLHDYKVPYCTVLRLQGGFSQILKKKEGLFLLFLDIQFVGIERKETHVCVFWASNRLLIDNDNLWEILGNVPAKKGWPQCKEIFQKMIQTDAAGKRHSDSDTTVNVVYEILI